jgi:hypothetical protein
MATLKSFRKLTNKFNIELIDTRVNNHQDDFGIIVSVTEKSTNKQDTYVYSSYWEKVEPEYGYFNNTDMGNYLEFHIWMKFFIEKKYSKEIKEGNDFLKCVTNSKLETFINSI